MKIEKLKRTNVRTGGGSFLLNKILPVIILIIVLGLSIGYSAFISKINISKIVTEVRKQENIRITGVSVASVSSTGTSSICTVTTDQGTIGEVDTGDIVTCTGNNISQSFYVMPDHDNAGSNTVSLLTVQNIDWSSDIQSANAEKTDYAETTYWTTLVNGAFIYNENSNLHQYVELYKETLEYMGMNVEEATLPSFKQLTSLGCTYALGVTTGSGSCENAPSWVYETSYFTGSAYSGALKVWAVSSTGNLETVENNYESGIRPVIIVDESELGINSTGGISNYEEYNVSRISVGTTLPKSSSSVTYKVEVTNLGNVEMGILEITGLPSNLEYELTDYTLKDKICDSSNTCKLGISKDFYITIKYKSNGYVASSTDSAYTYDLNLDFNFKEVYNVTYTDITNNNYPTTILETDTLTVDFGSSAPSNIKVLVDGSEVTNYTYEDGVLTLTNVMGDVEIIKQFEPIPLITYLTELYTPNSTATNNSITYNIDTTNGMIDDRLGGTVSSGGNIRYYGASPNNYIDIGDRDSSGNVILWRIIGVFKDVELEDGTTEDLVKIIRDESIGNYSWDYTSSGSYDNNWSNATLKTMLNGAYYNSTTTSYYNNSTTATTVDLTSIGLSTSAQEKIESVVWNLGGVSTYSSDTNYYYSLYSEGYYKWERGTKVYGSNPTTWTGKIALMYPSDYGYATDFTKCSQTLYKYNSSTCYSNDWLYNSSKPWTLLPNSNIWGGVFYVNSSRDVSSDSVRLTLGVRPVLYLKSDLIIEGEYTGSSTDPYVVSGGSTATSTG